MENKEEKTPVSTMDEIISHLGGFNRFQWIIEVLICSILFPTAFQILFMYFGGIDPPWRCRSNSSTCLFNITMPSDDSERCLMPREEWEYTESKEFSMVTQFDLQCERKWMGHVLTSVLFVGWTIGAIFLGYLSDMYGRKIILVVSYCTAIILGFLTSFLLSFPIMAVCRFIIGFCIPGYQIQCITIIAEYVGPKDRPKAIIMPSVVFSIAFCIFPLLDYYIRTWKTLMLVCTAPYFILIPLIISFIPESVRWLKLKGRIHDVNIILARIARFNKRELPSDLMITTAPINHHSNVLEILRTPQMAKATIIQCYFWFVYGMVYYGLAFAASDLGGSLHLNFFLLTVVGVPATIFAADLLERIGRKKTNIISIIVASISCTAVAITPMEGDTKILRVIFGMIGRFSISVTFGAIYVWAAELYPTRIRSNGMGLLVALSRIGAACAPWVAKGLQEFHLSVPFIVMAVAGISASGVLCFLPETKDVPTLETIEDVEQNFRNTAKRNAEVCLDEVETFPMNKEETP